MSEIESSRCNIEKAPLSLLKKYTLVEKITSYGSFMDITVNDVYYRIVYQTDDLATAEAWVQQSPKYNAYFTTDTPEVKKHVQWTIKTWKEDTEPWFEIYKPASRKNVIKAFDRLGASRLMSKISAGSHYYDDVWFFVVGDDGKRVVIETKGKKSIPEGFSKDAVKLFSINRRGHGVGRRVSVVTSGDKGYVHLWNVEALDDLDYVLWEGA